MSLKGKTLFIAGATRGIGKAIALRAARDGANIIVTGKTTEEDEKHQGTIYSAAAEIEAAGGKALAIKCDIRFEEEVVEAMRQGAEKFGGIHILVNNASAINLTGTLDTEMKRFDLMQTVNARGTFLCCKAALPYLQKADNPHILTLSPPLNMKPRWFARHAAYTMAKYGMSMITLGLAAEQKDSGIAVNSLWPETAIDTAAIRHLLGEDGVRQSRKTDIVADAAYWILTQKASSLTGNFFIDAKVLLDSGMTDLSGYAVEPGQKLRLDFFLDEPVSREAGAKAGDGGPVDTGGKSVSTASGQALAAVEGTGVEKPATAAFRSFTLDVDETCGIARLRLNRPESHNSLPIAFFEQELPEAIARLNANGSVRVLIISANGKSFSSGLDLNAFSDPDLLDTSSARKRERLNRVVRKLQDALNALDEARFPVICAIQGVCWGAGLDLASACDIRLATRDSGFSIKEVDLAIMADLGSLQRLTRLMPEGVVRGMAFTGDVMPAAAASNLGLINEIFEGLEELEAGAKKWAERIASHSPLAVSASKAALNYARDHSLADGLQHAALLQSSLLEPGDIIKAVAAARKKERANFMDLAS